MGPYRIAATLLTSAGVLMGTARAADRALALTFVEYTDAVGERTSAETVELLSRLGAVARARTVPPGETLPPDGVAIIVMPADGGRHVPRDVMGVVDRSFSGHALWIYPATVARTIGLAWEARAAWPADARDRFALALARVAVHEIIHIVCPWRSHDRHGLMAHALGRRALTGGQVAFAPELRLDFARGLDARSGAPRSLAARDQPPAR